MSTVVGVIPLSSLLSLATMTMNEKAKSSQFPNSDPSSPRRRRRRLCLCLCRPPSPPPPHPPRHGHKLFLRVHYYHLPPMCFPCCVCVSTSEVVVVERLGKFDRLLPAGLGCICCPCEQKAGTVSFRKFTTCLSSFVHIIALIQNNICHTMPHRRCSTA